ncbi:hypothetical protein D3C72_1274210 [compost metagenome]
MYFIRSQCLTGQGQCHSTVYTTRAGYYCLGKAHLFEILTYTHNQCTMNAVNVQLTFIGNRIQWSRRKRIGTVLHQQLQAIVLFIPDYKI